MCGFDDNHPCKGKDCLQCETCIFDEDLFLDKVQPNKKNNNMATKTCNTCVNLVRCYENRVDGRFDAACKISLFEAIGEKRPRRIDYNVSPSQDIMSPHWCPLRQSSPLGLPCLSTPSRPRPQDTGPHPSPTPTTPKPLSELSYSERREKMKELPRRISWDDIKEGKVYVIPKILNQSRKIVKVYTKTDVCCSCHEISDVTGNEFTYSSNFYVSDLDSIFITELHEF